MAVKKGVTKGPRDNEGSTSTSSSSSSTSSSTKTTTPTTTSTKTGTTVVPEYQGTGTTKSNSYVNQGEGNYTYNEKTGFYEKTPSTTPTTTTTTTPEVRTGETKVTPTTTPTATSTPSEYQGTGAVKTGTTTTTPSIAQNIRDTWNAKSYAEQQELLKNNPNMLNELAKYGATPKEAEKEAKKEETPKKEERDYQDNSPERMKEIADNVNEFSITNPGLFSDEDTFRNFFIDGKGRTPEQEKFLMDFYKNRKMYNKLDTYTSSQIGSMYVNGEIPDSYLTYLKNTDPERYNYVMDAKAKAEDDIKDEAAYDTVSYISGDTKNTTTGKAIEWLKAQGLFLDENGNLIDDRLEHQASEEEKTDVKHISELTARNLEIDNIVKHSYDDYVKAYPGATRATLMAMAQDVNSDLLREKENNLVEITRLQGYVDYLQSERQEMNKAGLNTINELQKQFGMYYTYSPEGMREQLEAQYEATNYSLDQAEYGTDTQKKIALDQILTEYYDKYGSIIQRPKAQVIMDVMDYAKKNGVSLKQALQENFVKPLQSKDEYKRMTASEPYTVKVGDVLYQYDFDTGEFTPVNATYGAGYGTGIGTMRTERNNNPTAMTTDAAKSLGLVEGEDYVKGDSFKDKYGNTLYTAKFLSDPVETTIKALDNGANSSKTHAFYTADGSQRRTHTAMSDADWLSKTQEEKEATVLKMLQREGGDINKMSYYNQGENDIKDYQNSKFGNLSGWNTDGYLNSLIQDYEAYLKSPKDYDKSDIEARYAPLGMSWYDFTSQATNYNNTARKQQVLGDAKGSLEAAVALYNYVNGDNGFTWKDALGVYMGALGGDMSGIYNLLGGGNKQAGLFNYVTSYILPQSKPRTARGYFETLQSRETLDKLIDTKNKGATYGSMTEGEWAMLKNAANMLKRDQTPEDFQKNLEDLIYGLQLSIQQGGGELPQNFAGSAAQNMVVTENARGRWDEYKTKPATTTTTETQQGEVNRF